MSAFSARSARGDRPPAQAGRGSGERGERDAAAGCSWSMSLLLSPKGRTRRIQRRALSTLFSPCFRPLDHLSGPPSHVSSPFPYPYRVIGMVMIALVGVATFDKTGTGATSILQAVIFSKPEAPVEER